MDTFPIKQTLGCRDIDDLGVSLRLERVSTSAMSRFLVLKCWIAVKAHLSFKLVITVFAVCSVIWIQTLGADHTQRKVRSQIVQIFGV